jgi:dienelactone hydrolase
MTIIRGVRIRRSVFRYRSGIDPMSATVRLHARPNGFRSLRAPKGAGARVRMPVGIALGLLALGCTTTPASPSPRAPRPLAPGELERFATPTIDRVEILSTNVDHGVRVTRGKISIEPYVLDFSTWFPIDRPGAVPFVDILPILAGGESFVESLGQDLAAAGFASGVLERPGRTFRDHETIEQLGETFVASVRHQRAFLTWAQAQTGVDPERIGLVGLSLGGMLGTVLGGVDPRVRWSAICIAGADLPDVMLHTNEIRVLRWGSERMAAEGWTPRRLQAELRERIGFDPSRFAQAIDPASVLFVRAAFDRTMPERDSSLLWECLGRPRRITLPTEHYGSALFLSWITGRIVEFAATRA